MKRKHYVVWIALILLSVGATVHLGMQDSRQIGLLSAPPPQMTAGTSAQFTLSVPHGDKIRVCSSDDAVLRTEVVSTEKGQIVCRATAVADGSAFLYCERQGTQSPAYAVSVVPPEFEPEPAPASGAFVASKSGEKYHLPSCAFVKKIKEENRLYFASESDAAAGGYSPCKQCIS